MRLNQMLGIRMTPLVQIRKRFVSTLSTVSFQPLAFRSAKASSFSTSTIDHNCKRRPRTCTMLPSMLFRTYSWLTVTFLLFSNKSYLIYPSSADVPCISCGWGLGRIFSVKNLSYRKHDGLCTYLRIQTALMAASMKHLLLLSLARILPF